MSEHFAVPDPANPDQMTYWYRNSSGALRAWPRGAKYGPPRLDLRVDPSAWEQYQEWVAVVNQAIADDPAGARARFAATTGRCSACGRKIWDPESAAAGMGPECRGA